MQTFAKYYRGRHYIYLHDPQHSRKSSPATHLYYILHDIILNCNNAFVIQIASDYCRTIRRNQNPFSVISYETTTREMIKYLQSLTTDMFISYDNTDISMGQLQDYIELSQWWQTLLQLIQQLTEYHSYLIDKELKESGFNQFSL